jgi:hypothetical protein
VHDARLAAGHCYNHYAAVQKSGMKTRVVSCSPGCDAVEAKKLPNFPVGLPK